MLAITYTLVSIVVMLVRSDHSKTADLGEKRLRAAGQEAPAVDVFICTYNEGLEVLEKTIIAAKANLRTALIRQRSSRHSEVAPVLNWPHSHPNSLRPGDGSSGWEDTGSSDASCPQYSNRSRCPYAARGSSSRS